MPLLNFSEEDLQILKKLVQDFKTKPRGKGPPTGTPVPNQASDIYLAKLPSGGLPPMTTAHENTSGEEDTPGSATCDIYKINSDGVLEDAGFTKLVYNMGEAWVETKYAQISKTKFGKWIVDSSGGTATGTGTGTGTSDICLDELDGRPLTDFPVVKPSQMLYIIGISTQGCLALVGLRVCTPGTGTGT